MISKSKEEAQYKLALEQREIYKIEHNADGEPNGFSATREKLMFNMHLKEYKKKFGLPPRFNGIDGINSFIRRYELKNGITS